MTPSTFTPTLRQQISLSFAYLAYSGELLTGDPAMVSGQIFDIMQDTMPQIPPLLDLNDKLDWEIVWGPAIYTFPQATLQDNLMFVVHQKNTNNYVVSVRGTNGLAMLDWVEEDLKVWVKLPWSVPPGVPVQGSPMISKATQDGIDVLLEVLKPVKGLPGHLESITQFLKKLATSGDGKNKFNLLFTGHSLAGALAPTLALWFKQSQKLVKSGDPIWDPRAWDPHGNASISTVPFAGPTAGDKDFANFFNEQLGSACDRIYNTLDIVPHAWQEATLHQIPDLYLLYPPDPNAPGIKMNAALQVLLGAIELTVGGYTQIGTANPITWTVQPKEADFLSQAGIQHTQSYPTLLQVPALLTVINNGKVTVPDFKPTLRQQVSLSFAYLAGSGAGLPGHLASTSAETLRRINDTMPKIPPLLDSNKKVDWKIVWGPGIYTLRFAKFQDNMMYVAQQISEPANYVIAIRGTDFLAIWDWITEDLAVWRKLPWSVPPEVQVQGSPMISKATHTGIEALRTMVPVEGIPGQSQTLEAFFNDLVASGKEVNLLFAGHSLGGALAPTLALWFKQSQNIAGKWDPQGKANISTVAFAGPTAGNEDFANYFNKQLGHACDRIYNTLDIVPQVWDGSVLAQLPNIYNPTIKPPNIPTIKPNLLENLLIYFIAITVTGYVQIKTTRPIAWTIQPEQTTYLAQVGIQHVNSYPTLLQVPELLTVIDFSSNSPTSTSFLGSIWRYLKGIVWAIFGKK